ncbi:related to Thioredoxin-2 [Hanseniaspora guilliermondii]|uniref:Related to Thioredoxin-2 n=1 Tax=Hanseniaspora guilliermondii TaxID=56406 RepID=A0A1L0B3A6_9ASCO|nr:related to Thioredoxin-2 [Hanseniaspora guilliermondii]
MIAIIATILLIILIVTSRNFEANSKSSSKSLTKKNNISKIHTLNSIGEEVDTDSDMIEIRNKSHYHSILNDKKKLVVLDFYSDTCGPCKMLAPFMEKFANFYDESKFTFGKVNCENLPEIVSDNSVTGMPTTIFYKNGHEVERVVGANVNGIKRILEKHNK